MSCSRLLLGLLGFAAIGAGQNDRVKPCPKETGYTVSETGREGGPSILRGGKLRVGPGVAFRCLGEDESGSFVHAGFSDGTSAWIPVYGTVVFQDPRVFVATADKAISGFLAGVAGSFTTHRSLEFLYFTEAILTGVPVKDQRVPIGSVNRIVIRSADFDIETNAGKYTVKIDHYNTSQPVLFMPDGGWIYVGNLPPLVLERRR